MNNLVLKGCNPRPLGSYLKAIGVLKLVATQKDPKVKGCWHNESFVLQTILSEDELCHFFCNEYVPTPIVSPWNGSSGFYLGDNTTAMDSILSSSDKRFQEYKEVILGIKSWPELPNFLNLQSLQDVLQKELESLRAGKKRNTVEALIRKIQPPLRIATDIQNIPQILLDDIEAMPKNKQTGNKKDWAEWWNEIKKARTQCNTILRNKFKDTIIPFCRARLPESSLQWIDAVGTFDIDNNSLFNPILGTGGNEGRLDFSNTFMQRVSELFIHGTRESAVGLFQSSIFNATVMGLKEAKVGQFDPGRAGGYNQGMEVATKEFKINPWDFVLLIEGALSFAGSVVRRNPTDDRSHFTMPFTVRFSPVGFSSSAHGESGQYETWFPLWENPSTYPELQYLLGEGRSTIGRKPSKNSIEFSRAAGTLGVDRGISSFERYAFLERRGQSKVALPTGRIKVKFKPALEYLNEYDSVIKPADIFMRQFKKLPASFQLVKNRIDETLFRCSQKADAYSFNNLIRVTGMLEKLIATRSMSIKPALSKPLYGLSPHWIILCDDGSIEVRIAAALASIHSTEKIGPIRSNMSGVDASIPWLWDKKEGGRYWHGSSLPERLGGVLKRRLLDAERYSISGVPFEGNIRLSAQDIMPFLRGDCNDEKIEQLLWGFTIINWKKSGLKRVLKDWSQPINEAPLSRAWCLLKLFHSAQKLTNTSTGHPVIIKREPRIAQLITANRFEESYGIALQRLRVSGVIPYDVNFVEKNDSQRLLASLLIPVREQKKLERLILKDN